MNNECRKNYCLQYISVNGTAASVGSVTSDSVEFTIESGTTTGFVTVSDGIDTFSTGLIFEMSKVLSGTLVPPSNVSLSGYTILSSSNISTVSDSDGSFTAVVREGFVTTVWAFRDQSDPLKHVLNW